MRKYLRIIQATWAQYLIYRLNFVFWRVRMVLQLLITYFLWGAIFADSQEVFGYNQSLILTYVLLSNLFRTLILSTATMEVGNIINSGELSNILLRPFTIFRLYIAKDTADKALNLTFAVGEIAVLFFILRPPLFLQSNPQLLGLSLLAAFLAILLYFPFSLIMSFLGFWTPDIWAPRFLSFVIIEFFAGGLFPLDILPRPLFVLAQSLPFSYLIYFPLKVYLGQLSLAAITQGLAIAGVWVGLLWCVLLMVWQAGLKVYTAEGR